MDILIAPNAFKHSLSADKAALAIQEGLRRSKLVHSSTCFPIGDGGDGTTAIIIKHCKGNTEELFVNDPLGRKISASYGLIDSGRTAVIEMASASGIQLLKPGELEPLSANSFGTGELIMSALEHGARKIVIAMGGSATVDGGVGIMQALGARFLDADQNELTTIPVDLASLDAVDLSAFDKRLEQCEITIWCDVDNLLLGNKGSAAIFGPQKGASVEDIKKLDAGLERLAEVALLQTGKNMATVTYGGTAGGAAAGLYAFLNANLTNGINHFLDLTNFDAALSNANLVITGEGSIDEQTLQGKGPFGVACQAKNKKIPVIVLAGKVPLQQHNGLLEYFDAILPIGNRPTDTDSAFAHTESNLIRTAETLGNLLALNKSYFYL